MGDLRGRGARPGLLLLRKRRGNLISEAFRPLLGDRVDGPIGKSINVLAIFATLFGSATSLGLGALQINSGMNVLWDTPTTNGLAVTIIVVLTICFVVSAVSGVHKGIQWLSNTNMVLAVILLAFLFVAGPAVFILDTLTESIGAYVTSLVPNSFRTGSFGDPEWLGSWTIFYWAWWISWAPFVGAFIARISRGRTIGQFVLGVLVVPSAVSFVWFAILGGTAIDLQLSGQADIVGAVGESSEAALFAVLEQFPLSSAMSLLVIVLVGLFFVSGADAASVVMGMLSCRGALNPPRWVTVLWGSLTGAAAAILLLAGGLEALQQAAIIAAAPFTLVMIGLCISLWKALAADRPAPTERRREPAAAPPGEPREPAPAEAGAGAREPAPGGA